MDIENSQIKIRQNRTKYFFAIYQMKTNLKKCCNVTFFYFKAICIALILATTTALFYKKKQSIISKCEIDHILDFWTPTISRYAANFLEISTAQSLSRVLWNQFTSSTQFLIPKLKFALGISTLKKVDIQHFGFFFLQIHVLVCKNFVLLFLWSDVRVMWTL